MNGPPHKIICTECGLWLMPGTGYAVGEWHADLEQIYGWTIGPTDERGVCPTCRRDAGII